ncbi:MAG TPA: hypothetical protein VGM39_02830 [Kofleriaceae bacterium]|jgi:flagellar biosynthesis/type III secretory pathway protein FliH
MSDIRPFLGFGAPAAVEARSLNTALKPIPTAPVMSPWLPQGTQPGLPAPAPQPEIDTAAIEAAAREQGHAEGLAQTEELRAHLKSAIAAFTSARDALKAPAADAIAAAAVAVIGAWTQSASDKDLFAPVVTAWLAGTSGPATATVAPAGVAAMQELVGEDINVIGDAAMKKGDVRLSSATRELSHQWDVKFPELREAIATALESK